MSTRRMPGAIIGSKCCRKRCPETCFSSQEPLAEATASLTRAGRLSFDRERCMNVMTSTRAPEDWVPPSAGVMAGLECAPGLCAATSSQNAATALALKQYQRLLKRRLGKPLQDLFHQLTRMRLHLWWHKPGPELSPSAVRKLCPRVTQGRDAKRVPACEECLRECWLPEWSSLQPEKRFACRCGATNYYACVKIHDHPVVTLLVQQPPTASRTAKKAFSRAVSLARLILHDLKATVEAKQAAVEVDRLRNELTAADSGRTALTAWEPTTALSSRPGKETLVRKPDARGQRPGANRNLITSIRTAAPGKASSEEGSGLAEPHTPPLNGNHRQQLVQRMLNYIHEHYSHPVELHDLAAAMNLNASYVSSLFSTTLGVTFHHYLENFRLARAEDLLRDPVKRVSEVAYAVGYSNAGHFRNVFTTRIGLPPSAWRQAQVA